MNSYIYNATIFDTAPDANLKIFPKIEPYAVIAENETEAQRRIVEMLFDPTQGGVLANHSRPDDSPTRFNIVFDEPIVSQVEWDDELETWVFADDDPPPEVRERQKEWAKSRLTK